MSVEGMWKFQTGSYMEPTVLRWGSIVVLETGRVFGGDSVMAHIGTFEVDRDVVRAHVRSFSWNHDIQGENVFGLPTPIDYEAVMEGTREGNVITGHIWAADAPTMKLPLRMEKIADLP